MLKIETSEWYFGKKIKISNDSDAFEILFGGNGDLYFVPVMNRMKLYESKEPIYFNVSKDDGFLYDSFETLYNNILAYDPVDCYADSFEEKEYQKKKDSFRKYPLVQDNIISWHSDEECQDTSSILNIYKLEDDIFKLEFIKNKPQNELYMTYSIRFRNSGSTYDPFNFRFMELYNNLCNYYFLQNNINEQKIMILKR